MPPIVRFTAAMGICGTNGSPAGSAAVTSYVPALSACTVTTANLTELSSQRVLTSVCVGSPPTLKEEAASPFGTTWPNVTHPGVSSTEPMDGAAAPATAYCAAITPHTSA